MLEIRLKRKLEKGWHNSVMSNVSLSSSSSKKVKRTKEPSQDKFIHLNERSMVRLKRMRLIDRQSDDRTSPARKSIDPNSANQSGSQRLSKVKLSRLDPLAPLKRAFRQITDRSHSRKDSSANNIEYIHEPIIIGSNRSYSNLNELLEKK